MRVGSTWTRKRRGCAGISSARYEHGEEEYLALAHTMADAAGLEASALGERGIATARCMGIYDLGLVSYAQAVEMEAPTHR